MVFSKTKKKTILAYEIQEKGYYQDGLFSAGQDNKDNNFEKSNNQEVN